MALDTTLIIIIITVLTTTRKNSKKIYVTVWVMRTSTLIDIKMNRTKGSRTTPILLQR